MAEQSTENRRKKCHGFWLRLRQEAILISNVRMSASKKINPMALIRTLTISTATFKRVKEKFYGLRQTENGLEDISCPATWLPPYKPEEISQSLSGHNFNISKCMNLKFCEDI